MRVALTAVTSVAASAFFGAAATASDNGAVFSLLGHIDRGDLAAAARMFAEPVPLTADGKDRIVAPAAFVRMVAECRFASVEARGSDYNTEISWACDEHSHHAKQIVAEVRGNDGQLLVDNVEVRNVPATPPIVLGPIH